MGDGLHADPALLSGLASKLRHTSSDLENGISEPPSVEAGAVTGAIDAAIAQLADSLGNIVIGVGSAGDSVAESRAIYVDTDYEQAAAMKSSEINAEQPR